MNFVPARPVIRDGPSVFAYFYPLYNPACPPATTTQGECVIHRMMRGKSIQVQQGGHVRTQPTLVYCRECKLGFVAAKWRFVAVECIHGLWMRSRDPKTETARRLGADVFACDLCGRAYRPRIDTWEYVGEKPPFFRTLFYCGDRCRDRAARMPLLT